MAGSVAGRTPPHDPVNHEPGGVIRRQPHNQSSPWIGIALQVTFEVYRGDVDGLHPKSSIPVERPTDDVILGFPCLISYAKYHAA